MRDTSGDYTTGWLQNGNRLNDYNIVAQPMRDGSRDLTTGWIAPGEAFDDCCLAAGLSGLGAEADAKIAVNAKLADKIVTDVAATDAASVVRNAKDQVLASLPTASTYNAKIARGIIRHSKEPRRELREFYINVAVDGMIGANGSQRFARYAALAPLPGNVDASMASAAATEAITAAIELASEAAEGGKQEALENIVENFVPGAYDEENDQLGALGKSFGKKLKRLNPLKNKKMAMILAPITMGATLIANKEIRKKITGAIETVNKIPYVGPVIGALAATVSGGAITVATYKETAKGRAMLAAAAGAGAALSAAGAFTALAPGGGAAAAAGASKLGPEAAAMASEMPMESLDAVAAVAQSTGQSGGGLISTIADWGMKITTVAATGKDGLRSEGVSFLTSLGIPPDMAASLIDKAEKAASKQFEKVKEEIFTPSPGVPGPGAPGVPGPKIAEAGMFGGGMMMWVVLGLGGLALVLSARRAGGGGGSRHTRRSRRNPVCVGPYCMNPRHGHRRRRIA